MNYKQKYKQYKTKYLELKNKYYLIQKHKQIGGNNRPNILLLMGDDIGITNLSIYSKGLMGYKTPNIDSIGKEGIVFTDHYAEQSCTAGRSSFITGQCSVRTGLTKVGMPGAPIGLSEKTPTIATLLKKEGYCCGQFGKNHFGDRNKFLPTNHGFDEFYGNLYHLNAEEEPEQRHFPDIPEMENFRPRGIIHSWTKNEYNAQNINEGVPVNVTGKPHAEQIKVKFAEDGNQIIQDTGPLSKNRMEFIDRDIVNRTKNFIKKKNKGDKPWMVWFCTTGMHFRTHINKKSDIYLQSGKNQSIYHDVMIEHDKIIGELLELVDENTLVIYTTDNGPHVNTWPDAGTTPFRSEKNTNWEGAFRVPFLCKGPGIPKGQILNGIQSHIDILPTVLDFAGVNFDELNKGLLEGNYKNMNYKVHLDGYSLKSFWQENIEENIIIPAVEKNIKVKDKLSYEYNIVKINKDKQNNKKISPRNHFFYFSDDGDLIALRYGHWKVVFLEQREEYTLKIWANPFTPLRTPLLFNLRMDPFEKAQKTSNTYYDWLLDHVYIYGPAIKYCHDFLKTFEKYPAIQKSASFTIGDIEIKVDGNKHKDNNVFGIRNAINKLLTNHGSS